MPKTIFVMFVLFSTCTFAGKFDYQCEILDVAFVGDTGRIDLVAKSPLVGKRFAVDRASGDLVGGDLFPVGTPRLLSGGNKDNAFKVIWSGPARNNGVLLDTLSIEEFARSERKPFAYHSGGRLVTGLCN